MNYLSVENLSKNFGERVLFENLNFGLNKGDKYALIANNGTGKSSLLKIITGKDTPNDGTVVLRDGVRIGFLNQEPEFDLNQTIDEMVKGANSKVLEVIKEYNQAVDDQSEDYTEKTQKAFEIASAKMDEFNAWDHERHLEQMLTRFGIIDKSQVIADLSGGQRKRLALALVLLDNPDLLILDEPTNHLDIEMIEWLEKFLQQGNITLLMVTHDRYFLDRVCNHILELNEGKLYHHKGNYSFFLLKRQEREQVYQIEREKAGKLMKKELEWMRRMPKARTTKSKSRIDSFYKTKAVAKSGKKGQELNLDVKMSRIGGKILELKKVRKAYGDLNIINGFDYSFRKGERIGIVGKNGVGKSTFLNIITGQEIPDSGKVNVGETIVYGYYHQSGLQLKEDKRVIDVLKDYAEVLVLADGSKVTASQFLNFFLFPPEMQYTYFSKLSGGEKRRLHLLTVLIKNPNFLILDEPTNDLDLITLSKLESFLEAFGGCLIIVSHDRYFMDNMVDQLFVFEGEGKISGFVGNYSDFKEKQKQDEKVLKQNKIKAPEKQANKPKSNKVKLSYNEQREHHNLEKDIEKLEKKKVDLEKELAELVDDFERISAISEKLGALIDELDEKSFRWLELEEMKG